MTQKLSHISTFEWQRRSFEHKDSHQAIEFSRNLHCGRRAFIVANGPSLDISDLDLLQNEITFAANKIYLAYEKTEWRPTYWCCSDALVAENNLQAISQLQHIKFGAFSVSQSLKGLDYTYIVDGPVYHPDKIVRYSSLDLLKGIHPGVSVMIFMIKLALWMGIDTLYLIGLDFDFKVPDGSQTEEKIYDNNVIISQGEVNHFHPDYRKPGEKWTYPKMEEQKEEFTMMKWKTENSGRKIFNASRKTKLSVFDRVQFDTLIHKA